MFNCTIAARTTNCCSSVVSLAASSTAVQLVVSVGRLTGRRGSAAVREEAGTLWVAREERLPPSLDGALAEGARSVPLLQPHIHTLGMEN